MNQTNKSLTEEQLQKAKRREENYVHTVATEKRHELLFEPYSASFQLYRVLAYLVINQGDVLPSQIADDLLILRQTMTHTLDTMEHRGLVERVRDPDDRRKVRVHLLPDGYDLAVELMLLEDEYSKRLRKHLTKEELDEYYRLEGKMYKAKEATLAQIIEERQERKAR